MSVWSRYVLPRLIESACKSPDILEERRRWIPRAHGRVLEIGVGSGLNLAFYDPARVEKVVGVDPSIELARRAEARVRHAKVPIELVTAGAERLPFEAGAFDSAVMTYTLCSVDDARLALAEARRVLVPGGELFFVEHGRAPDADARRWQARLGPVWRRAGGGCRLESAPLDDLASAGFELDEVAAGYSDGARWLSYTYEGIARSPTP